MLIVTNSKVYKGDFVAFYIKMTEQNLTSAAFMLQYELAEIARKRERNLKIAKAVARVPGKILRGAGKAIKYVATKGVPLLVAYGAHLHGIVKEQDKKYKQYEAYSQNINRANLALQGKIPLNDLTEEQMFMLDLMVGQRQRQARDTPYAEVVDEQEYQTTQNPEERQTESPLENAIDAEFEPVRQEDSTLEDNAEDILTPEAREMYARIKKGIREIYYFDHNGNQQVRYHDGKRFVKSDGTYNPKKSSNKDEEKKE